MKTLFIWCAVLTLGTACSKKDKPEPVVYGEEDPLPGFLARSFYSQETYAWINELGGMGQFGMSFIPLVNGKINSLVIKMPAANEAIKVIIWDKATRSKIRVETVKVPAANTLVTKAITPLALVKDKEYVITMFTDDYYARNKTGNGVGSFPVVSGNIKVTGSVSGTVTNELFPLGGSGNQYFGDCSFLFQQTN